MDARAWSTRSLKRRLTTKLTIDVRYYIVMVERGQTWSDRAKFQPCSATASFWTGNGEERSRPGYGHPHWRDERCLLSAWAGSQANLRTRHPEREGASSFDAS